MVKNLLEGTLEEQCEFLYDLGVEKLKTGNFAGALYAFREIVRHDPAYRDVAALLVEARGRKSEQRQLILVGLGSGALFMGVGRLTGISHDLALILVGALGLVCGYLGCTWIRMGSVANPFDRSLS